MATKVPSSARRFLLPMLASLSGMLFLVLPPASVNAQVQPGEAPAADNRSPVYFECRNNRLYHVDFDSAKEAADRATEAILERVGDDKHAFQMESTATTLTLPEGYRMPHMMTLIGKYAFTPDPNHEGYDIEGALSLETSDKWFGGLLANIDPERQFICFFVRPDSFPMFQKARNLAWGRNINVSCELLTMNDPITLDARLMKHKQVTDAKPHMDIPQEAMDTPAHFSTRQKPIYVDVENDRLTIYPEKTVVPASEIDREDNEFEKFLNRVELIKDARYIVLMLRPDSAVLQRRIRTMIKDRGIDIGFEPFDFGREIIITNQ